MQFEWQGRLPFIGQVLCFRETKDVEVHTLLGAHGDFGNIYLLSYYNKF